MDHRMRVVILAAGKGVRMGGEAPKVLHEVAGRPMIDWVRSAVAGSGIDPHPVIVIGYNGDRVRAHCGEKYTYVEQHTLAGTGDAVRVTEPALAYAADHIMVLYGDSPCVDARSICDIADTHVRTRATVTLMTATVSNFDGWGRILFNFGRIYRDAHGTVKNIIERRDASTAALAIREVNSGVYCFSAPWLWEHLPQLTVKNAQREYYLTDLIACASGEGKRVSTVTVDPVACLGVNTPDEWALVQELLAKRGSGILTPYQRSPSSFIP